MSSLQQRVADFATAVGTDYKQLRVWITGSSTGDLTALTTTAKTSIVAAINEVKAGASGAPPQATEAQAGVAQVATNAEVLAGTIDTDMVTPLKLVQKLTAWAQPLNANLTALAALASQTAYGQALLTVANQAGLMALFPTPTDTTVGLERHATNAEVTTGTMDTASVTPLKLQTRLAAFAVPLTYLDTDGTLAGNSDTRVATQKAVRTYVGNAFAANDAMMMRGVIDASASPNYPAASAGDVYKISVAGKIGGASGPNVEAGDTLYCLVDGTAAGTQATVGANWDIVQTNIDGAVIGPVSAASGDIATFSGTGGKVVQDSGVAVSTDATLAAGSNAKLPTELAIKTYTATNYYTQTQLGNPDTDLVALYTSAKA